MPTPPYIDPVMPDPRKRMGLLGGLQSIGGLLGRGLSAAGHNFDRNAIGGIDAAMGGEFTKDMRRSARANAVMSIGQMLATQGKTPITEGLHKGQDRILGGWKVGRDRRREDEAMQLLQGGGVGQMPVATRQPVNTTGTPAEPPGAFLRRDYKPRTQAQPAIPTLIEKLEEQYLAAIAEAKRLSGNMHPAVVAARDKAIDVAMKIQERIVQLSEVSGPPVIGTDASGNRVYASMNKMGQPIGGPGVTPDRATAFSNEGDASVLRDTQTNEAIGPRNIINESLGAKLAREQQNKQFGQSNIWAGINANNAVEQTAITKANNREQNAIARERNSIGWGQLANDQAKTLQESIYGKPMTSNDAGEAASLGSMMDHIDLLSNALKKDGPQALKRMVTGDAEFAEVIRNMVDQLGHHRSQGQVSGREMGDYKDLVANPYNLFKGKGIDAALRSLQSLRNESEVALVLMDPSGRTMREQKRIKEGRPQEPPPPPPMDPRVKAYIEKKFGPGATVRPK